MRCSARWCPQRRVAAAGSGAPWLVEYPVSTRAATRWYRAGEARGRLEAQGKGGGHIESFGEFARGVLAAGVNVGDGAGRRERDCAGRPCWTNTNKQQAHTRDSEPLVYVRRGGMHAS